MGNKKRKQEPTAVKDPVTGKVATDLTKIKEIIIKYVKKLILTNHQPNPGFEAEHEVKKDCMNDQDKLTQKVFSDSLKVLKSKKGDKYQFIIKAGEDYRNALFSLFQSVWEKKEIPTGWKKTTLLQLYKGRGNLQVPSC